MNNQAKRRSMIQWQSGQLFFRHQGKEDLSFNNVNISFHKKVETLNRAITNSCNWYCNTTAPLVLKGICQL